MVGPQQGGLKSMLEDKMRVQNDLHKPGKQREED